jgi:hypothetical protein
LIIHIVLINQLFYYKYLEKQLLTVKILIKIAFSVFQLHAYFDPAGFATLTDPEKRSVEQTIKIMVADENFCPIESVVTALPILTPTTNTCNQPVLYAKSNKSSMDVFNELVGEFTHEETTGDKNKKATIIDDIHNYRRYVTKFNIKHKPDVTSATLFWQTYGQHLSMLGKLAKKMLSTPATSVPSESCFSVSAFLGRKERARLTGENLSSSVFLKDKISF